MSGARCILSFLPRTLCAIALSMWTFEEMVVNEWTVAWPFFRLECRVLLIEILARRFRSTHEMGSKLTHHVSPFASCPGNCSLGRYISRFTCLALCSIDIYIAKQGKHICWLMYMFVSCACVCTATSSFLWSPIYNRADHCRPISSCGFYLSIFLFSSPNLSSRRLDVYRTSAHGVVLV